MNRDAKNNQEIPFGQTAAIKKINILCVDTNFCYFFFNELHKQAMHAGWGVDIVQGMSLLDCITEQEARLSVQRNLNRALSGETHIDIKEYGNVKRHIWESIYSPIYDAAGKIFGASITSFNVTEFKQAEEALKKRERKYQTLFDNTTEGFLLSEIICDENGHPFDFRILEVNKSFEQQTGINANDIVGKSVLEYYPDIERSWIERFGEVTLTQKPHRFTEYNHNTDKHYEVSAFPYEIGQFALLFKDITEQKKNEEALKESENMHRHLFENIGVGIIYAELDGKILRVNNAFCQFIGYSEAELIQMSFQDITHPDDIAKSNALMAKQIDGKIDSFTLEKRYIYKDGSIRWGLLNASVVRKEGGSIHASIGAITDITIRKQAEIEIIYSEVLEELVTGSSITEVLTTLILSYEKYSPDTRCSILLMDDDGKHFTHTVAPSLPAYYHETFDNMHVNPEAGPWGKAALTGERVIIEDINSLDEQSNCTKLAEKTDLHACWSEPIISSTGNIIGVFSVYYGGSAVLEKSDLSFIQNSARLTSIAIERNKNIRKIKDSEERFRALFKQAGAYCMILQPTASGIPEILDINEAACIAHGYTRAEMIGKPIVDIDDEIGKKLCIERTKLIMTGKPFSDETNHVRKDGSTFPVQAFAKRVNIEGKSPIILTTEYDISERKQSELENIVLLQQNRILNRRMFKIQEEERHYIARELHDEFGQWLTAINLNAYAISMSSKEVTDIHASAQVINVGVNEMHKSIRSMVNHLRPILLTEFGLEESLKGLIEQWQSQYINIKCLLSINGAFNDFDDEFNITIYRIIQEGLTNVAKHANATDVIIQLTHQPRDSMEQQRLVLTIKDNGVGMDTLINTNGLGLLGMRERVLAIGGDFSIKSKKGGGLNIKAIFIINPPLYN